jgi:hypothetical protein
MLTALIYSIQLICFLKGIDSSCVNIETLKGVILLNNSFFLQSQNNFQARELCPSTSDKFVLKTEERFQNDEHLLSSLWRVMWTNGTTLIGSSETSIILTFNATSITWTADYLRPVTVNSCEKIYSFDHINDSLSILSVMVDQTSSVNLFDPPKILIADVLRSTTTLQLLCQTSSRQNFSFSVERNHLYSIKLFGSWDSARSLSSILWEVCGFVGQSTNTILISIDAQGECIIEKYNHVLDDSFLSPSEDLVEVGMSVYFRDHPAPDTDIASITKSAVHRSIPHITDITSYDHSELDSRLTQTAFNWTIIGPRVRALVNFRIKLPLDSGWVSVTPLYSGLRTLERDLFNLFSKQYLSTRISAMKPLNEAVIDEIPSSHRRLAVTGNYPTYSLL